MPTIPSIRTSIENKSVLVLDEHAKNGTFERDARNRLIAYTGGFSVVFPYKTSDGKKWAFRCWHSDVSNSKKRYETIAKAIRQAQLDFLCDFDYIEKGINVEGVIYPTTRMRWVEGITIKDFIYQNKDSKKTLKSLAENFLKMTHALHEQSLAHGDLQHGNILVDNNNQLHLVDYDSFYCPQLKGKLDTITGLADYQHPSRIVNKTVSEKLDYFSELIIFLSILAIAQKPSLAEKYRIKDADRLLFSKEDFKEIRNSKIYQDIRALGRDFTKYLDILEYYLKFKSINELKPFEEVLQDSKQENTIIIEKNRIRAWLTDPKMKRKSFAVRRFGALTLFSADELSRKNLRGDDEIRLSTQSRWHKLSDYIDTVVPTTITSIPPPLPERSMTLSTESIIFESQSSSKEVWIHIYLGIYPDDSETFSISNYSSVPYWLHTQKTNQNKIVISVDENTGEARSSHVTIKCRSLQKTIVISQKGAVSSPMIPHLPFLTLSTYSIAFGPDSNSNDVTVSVDSRDNWIVSNTPPHWIHVKKKNRETIEISVDKNTGSNRNALVEIKCGSLTKSIAVKQDADVKPDVQTSEDRWIYFIISFGGPVMLILLIQMILKSLGIYLNDWEWSDFWGYCVVIMVVDILVIIIAAANSK